MSASRPNEDAAAQAELLARLGLPAGASPEDIDNLHYAVSQYLAAAPSSLRPWAHAQAAALDQAYLLLTDPVGFQGSALRSPTRPPTVVPGGPATPPARRGPAPEAAAFSAVAAAGASAAIALSAEDLEAEGAEEPSDFEALYASVTPSAHAEMGPEVLTAAERNRRKRAAEAAARAAGVMPVMAAAPTVQPNPWKRVALALGGVVALVAVLFVGYNLGGGGSGSSALAQGNASVAPSSAIDMTQVAALMTKLQANPKDTATMQSLGDLYYAGADYTDAANFYDDVLAIDPSNVNALLARGAVYFNSGDMVNAQTAWNKVVTTDPNNVEAHYDLGFLAMNLASPDWAAVQREWYKVIQLDPGSSVATTVQQHLASLVAASMIPATPVPSGSAAGSPAASGAASPAPSTPSGSTPAPSGSPAPSAS